MLVRLLTNAPARRALVLRAAAAAALSLGYIDLIRGGTTTSALLLVIAYLVLVPAALL
jgi:hypothetical protein